MCGVKCIILGAPDAFSLQVFRAALAEHNLAHLYFLAMIDLDAQTLGGRFAAKLRDPSALVCAIVLLFSIF